MKRARSHLVWLFRASGRPRPRWPCPARTVAVGRRARAARDGRRWRWPLAADTGTRTATTTRTSCCSCTRRTTAAARGAPVRWPRRASPSTTFPASSPRCSRPCVALDRTRCSCAATTSRRCRPSATWTGSVRIAVTAACCSTNVPAS